MTNQSDQTHKKELTSQQSLNLRRVLVACHYMKTSERRQQVVSDFQRDHPQITFETDPDPETQVSIYIDRCWDFGGDDCLKSFVKALQGFEKSESNTMKAVWDEWNKIIAPPPIPLILVGPRPDERGFVIPSPESTGHIRPPNEFSKVGSDFHWDRDDWVNEFLDVVIAKPGKEDICVMAFPAPPAADPDGFVQYLEAKCNVLSRSTDLTLRIAPVRLQLTEPQKVFPTVARILDLLASKSEHCQKRLRDAAQRTRKQWEPLATRPQLDEGELAKDFAGYLCEAAETCRPVILLHSFEAASEELRNWILYTWLESHQIELAGTVVAIAGNQGLGLEYLNQPPHMICRPPLQAMEAADLWKWAYYGHGLTWLPLEFVAKHNQQCMHGSARSFRNFIETCKALEQWVSSKEDLLALLSKPRKSEQ